MTKEECAKMMKEKIDEELINFAMENPESYDPMYGCFMRPYVERIACFSFDLGTIYGIDSEKDRVRNQ